MDISSLDKHVNRAAARRATQYKQWQMIQRFVREVLHSDETNEIRVDAATSILIYQCLWDNFKTTAVVATTIFWFLAFVGVCIVRSELRLDSFVLEGSIAVMWMMLIFYGYQKEITLPLSRLAVETSSPK